MATRFPESVAERVGESETNPNVINVTRIEPSFRMVQSFHLGDFRCEARCKKSRPFLADPKQANLPTFGNVTNHSPLAATTLAWHSHANRNTAHCVCYRAPVCTVDRSTT